MTKQIQQMTKEELVELAKEKGYTTRPAKEGNPRIGGSEVKEVPDYFMNEVNVLLWKQDNK